MYQSLYYHYRIPYYDVFKHLFVANQLVKKLMLADKCQQLYHTAVESLVYPGNNLVIKIL